MFVSKNIPLFSLLGFLVLPQVNCAQSFYFRNYMPLAGVNAPIYDSDGIPLYGSEFSAMLYGGPTPDNLAAALSSGGGAISPVPFTYIAPGNQQGYFMYDGGHVIIPNVWDGAWACLQIRAWDNRLGATYDEVAALGRGGYGESRLFWAQSGNTDGGVPSPPGVLTGLQSFSLLPVPEPGMWTFCAAFTVLALCGELRRWRVERKLLCPPRYPRRNLSS